jgi:hypothetical protein
MDIDRECEGKIPNHGKMLPNFFWNKYNLCTSVIR